VPTLTTLPVAPTCRYHPGFSTVTASGGRVVSATDLMSVADVSEGASGIGPKIMTDANGHSFWRLEGAEYLNIAAGLAFANTRDTTVFAVCRIPRAMIQTRIMSAGSAALGTGANGSVLLDARTSNGSEAPFVGNGRAAPSGREHVIPGAQLQVIGNLRRTTANGGDVVFLNRKTAVIGVQGSGTTSVTGGEIGRYSYSPGASGAWGSFDLYELIIYNARLTVSQCQDIQAALADNYAIEEIDSQLILEGDSISQGTGLVIPSLACAAIITNPGAELVPPNWRVINVASSGAKVSTLVSRRDTTDSWVNFLLPSENVMAFEIGHNDWAAGETDLTHYANVVAYLNTTTTGVLNKGWTVRTMANISSGTGLVQTYLESFRAMIRDPQYLVDTSSDAGGAFPGKVSIVDTDLIEYLGGTIFLNPTDADDLLYYIGDKTHPTILGAQLRVNGGDTPTRGIAYGLGVPAVSSAVIKFGDLTPAGEGTQDITASDGTYSVGGGSFSVNSNRIDVVTMPAVGTYSVDGVGVEVVADARTVSTNTEIANRWKDAAATHPPGTRILVAPGAYDFFSLLSGGVYLANDWLWTAIDPESPPLFNSSATGALSYYASTGAGSSALEYIDFYRPQSALGIPWNVDGRDIFTVKTGATVTMLNCRMYSDFVPAQQGGRLKTKVVGPSVDAGGSLIAIGCEWDHLCTGARIEGLVYIAGTQIHDVYSDFFELRAGVSGIVKNCHMYNDIGDGTLLHGDWVQMQVPPHSPKTVDLIFEGNTCTRGDVWALACTQADFAKADSVTLSSAGPIDVSDVATYHGLRMIQLDPAAAGGSMTVALPAASYREFMTYVYRMVSNGNVNFTLEGSDTAIDSLTMTAKEDTRTFISNGVDGWGIIEPGYRGYMQIRTANKILDEMEQNLLTASRATTAPLEFTLPPGTTAYTTIVKKYDTTDHDTVLKMPAGQTYTYQGVSGLTTDLHLSVTGASVYAVRAAASSTWTITDGVMTRQGFFSNGPDDGWDGLVVRYNIFFVNSPNAFRPDDNTLLGSGVFTNSLCHNNTFLRQSPPDWNGDGIISDPDGWNAGTVGNIHVFDGVDTFRNVCTGGIVENGPSLRYAENVAISGWTVADDLSPLSGKLAVTNPVTLRPVTREECVTSALAASGGSLVIDSGSHSYIGAVGTTAENGPYNWTTGAVNTNTKAPAISSSFPAIASTDVARNQSILITFDELITLGTGSISIREVGGAEVVAYDVETASELNIGSNGTSLTINPAFNLDASTNFCVRIDPTAIDGYFNSFAGIADDSFEFTTGTTIIDPELLIDPPFDVPAEWTAGTGGAGVFPNDGWTVSGGLASKVGGTSSFRDLHVVTKANITAGITYVASVDVGTITDSTGSLRVQLKFYDASDAQLSANNTQLALSGLTTGSRVSHQEIAPAGAVTAQFLVVATSGTAAFTLTDASLKNLDDVGDGGGNSAPTNISLDSTSIAEGNAINSVVGTLTTTDADGADTHVYTLAVGTGDDDNGSFNIFGSQLRASEVFDYATKSSYSVRIQTNDGNGGVFAKAFTITVTDVADEVILPTIIQVIVSASEFLIQFSEEVTGYTGLALVGSSGDAIALTGVTGSGTASYSGSVSRPPVSTESLALVYAPGNIENLAGNALAAIPFRLATNTVDGSTGGGTVVVVTGQSQSVHLEINQVSLVEIPAVDSSGDPLDWTDKTLRFVVTDYRKAVLLDLADGSISRGTGSFTVAIDSGLTAKKRTLRWRLLEVSGAQEAEIIQGLFPVY
jgi:hypothetical protein